MADSTRRIGFHGKMPSMGDFVSRRLPSSFVESWDDWMQSCMAFSKESIADRWAQTYMVGPVWRFFLQSGVIGSDAWCGLMFPSVDRVGRYFPFALVVPLEGDANASSLFLDQSSWFDDMEALALEVLKPSLQFEEWDKSLEAWPPPFRRVKAAADGDDITVPLKPPDLEPHQRVILPLGPDTAALIDWLANNPGRPLAFWWKRYASGPSVSMQITDGLPDPSTFPAFLGEDWTRWGWADKTYIAGA